MFSDGTRQGLGIPEPAWTLLTAVSGVGDERERARLIATGLPSLLRCELSGLALFDGSDSSWNLVVQAEGRQLPPSETRDLLAGLMPLFDEAFRRPAPLRVTVGGQDTEGSLPPALEVLGIECLTIVPLMTLRSRVGALLVGRREAEAFCRDDALVLLAVAEHAAVGIENLRLYERLRHYSSNLEALVEARTAELHRSEQRQRALLEISNAIVANLDRPGLFEAIAAALGRVLPFERASVTLYDPARDVLTVYALAGPSPTQALPVGAEFPRQGSHLEGVVSERRTLLRRDLEAEPRGPLEDLLLRGGIRSYVAAPLVTKGKVLGTLNVGSETPRRYGEEDARFVEEIATQVAPAVDNMLAYEEIARLKARLEQENVYLQEEIKTQHNFEELVGQSPALRRALKAVETVAPTDAPVLILGETGTGKELVARALHDLSARRAKPLVKVNCAALPAGLFESELFGHEKGAFTGALARKIGRFELADGGTLFLDEVGELPLELQVKLLRALQEGEFERVGGATVKVDVRVIAATNRNLETAMQEGRFRPDLFYRLHVFPIPIPPLRERPEDVPLLVRYFVAKCARRLGKTIETVPQRALDTLLAYPWPGNVRELENVIERAVIVSAGPRLDLGDWLPAPGARAPEARVPTLEELERDHIVAVLEMTGWRVSGERGAAKVLGLRPTTLEARMKKFGITRQR